MKQLATAALLLACLLIVLGMVNTPRTDRSTQMEVLAQPEAAAQLEAQRQAHAQDMAEIQARLESERMEAHTMRLAIIAALVIVIALIGAAVLWGALAMSGRKRQETYILLPGTQEFRRALTEQGGSYIDGIPMLQGREVALLERIEE